MAVGDAFPRGRKALVGDRGRERASHIVVTPGHLEHLMVSFTRTWQRPPTAQELAGLIDDYIREEELYREALVLGLDRDDTLIRRLRQKLEPDPEAPRHLLSEIGLGYRFED